MEGLDGVLAAVYTLSRDSGTTHTTGGEMLPMTKRFTDLLHIVEESGRHRFIDRVPAGPFQLSIQASEFNYSTPRQTVPLNQYTEWEVAVFQGDEWCSPETHPDLFPAETAERWEAGAGSTVGGYIPTAAVQELYERACAYGK